MSNIKLREDGDDLPEVESFQPISVGIDTPSRRNGPVKARLLRVRNMVSDVFENTDGKTEVVEIKLPQNSENLLEEFVPEDYREDILRLSQDFEVGKTYIHKWAVGKKEIGTQHGHYFLFRREENSVKIYFVDPEDRVGVRNTFRPSVTNLMAAEIFDYNRDPKFAVTRFRYKNPESRIPLRDLVPAALDLVDTNAVPEFLVDNDDYQLTFRIVGEHDFQLVESRHAHKAHLEKYLSEGKGCWHLEGKAQAQRAILRIFIKSLKSGEYRQTSRY
jgi:hypothetical protein